ncbi:helix-turn-helix domain-containing protein [Wolbachia endosymbiont (group A) of Bombylius major]|uniref:helix-turn-helix domain-containing protein n=1 Tax=Wolbachia endosymbiont (group A) of Bombylius major TaxID=2953988 RepID=UPI002232C976|nr:helix-turn-helix transcriptional regulator [Wolbachia endosymbiont (group A) of Bombylius major]
MKKSNPARYKIGQKVRSWRLRRKCTVKDLVDKTDIKYYTLLKYEQGVQGIPTEDLKRLADALSIKAGGLFSRQKVLRENCCFDKAKEQAIYNLMAQTRERKAIYALTQSIRAEEESDVKAGFANDIISRATGLSADEYENKEEKSSKH